MEDVETRTPPPCTPPPGANQSAALRIPGDLITDNAQRAQRTVPPVSNRFSHDLAALFDKSAWTLLRHASYPIFPFVCTRCILTHLQRAAAKSSTCYSVLYPNVSPLETETTPLANPQLVSLNAGVEQDELLSPAAQRQC